MNEVDVKQALSILRNSKKMTQAEIAAELGCTQSNVCYHLNNPKKGRASERFVEGIKAAFARREMEVPMYAVAGEVA